ncbi:MAG TPA: phytanoyl-CoA dioxygenase family protein [Ilumatobacter sp.]|nr:phytanoyl-CoA dioxygenase family protein [Ilumatobacter sp.]
MTHQPPHPPLLDDRLSGRFTVTDDQVAQFWRDGYLRLGGVLDPALLTDIEPLITGKVIELNTMHLPMEERSTYDRAFLQVTNLARHDDTVRRFVLGARLAGIAADLLRVPAVRLYADQALYKEPGGGITPWHADQYYWPLASDLAVTVWIPLQDTPSELGPLEFARGSHRVDIGRDVGISDESEQSVSAALEAGGLDVDHAPYSLGDVSYHLGWTFHRARPNQSDVNRRVMTIVYVDAEMRTVAPRSREHQESFDITMPGVRPGEQIDTAVNPVIATPARAEGGR